MTHKNPPPSFWFELLGRPSDRARCAAVYNLSQSWPLTDELLDRIIGEFVKLFEFDPVVDVRRMVAWGFAEIGSKAFAAIPTLIDGARDQDEMIRWYSVVALNSMGRRAAPSLPVLVDALDDANPGTRIHAAKAIASIGADAIESILATAGWPSEKWVSARTDAPEYVYCLIALACGLRVNDGDKDKSIAMADFLTDQRHEVRRSASASLITVGQHGVDSLALAIQHTDAVVRFFAAAALEGLGHEAVPRLKALLADADSDVRYIAGRTLAKIEFR